MCSLLNWYNKSNKWTSQEWYFISALLYLAISFLIKCPISGACIDFPSWNTMPQHANPYSHTLPCSNTFCLPYSYKMLKEQLCIFFKVKTFVWKKNNFKVFKIFCRFQTLTVILHLFSRLSEIEGIFWISTSHLADISTLEQLYV